MNENALLLNVDAVSKLTSMSVRSVWRMSDAGSMPRPLAVGRSRRWRRADVEEWARTGCPDLRAVKAAK